MLAGKKSRWQRCFGKEIILKLCPRNKERSSGEESRSSATCEDAWCGKKAIQRRIVMAAEDTMPGQGMTLCEKA